MSTEREKQIHRDKAKARERLTELQGLPPLARKPHGAAILSVLLLYPECLQQYLTLSRYSIDGLFSRSVVSDSFATPWTLARQASLSVGCPRQEWGVLPFPSPGDLPDPGIDLLSPALQAGSFPGG